MKIDDKKIRVGVYGILIRDHKILMVRTQSGDRLVYNFPGGGIEFHEGLASALIRECEEEIGTTITIKEHVYSSQKLYEHKSFPGTCSLGLYYTIECANPIDLKKQGAVWFDLDNLPMDEMLEPDIEFAEFVRAGLVYRASCSKDK